MSRHADVNESSATADPVTPPSPVQRAERVFAGDPEQVADARAFVVAHLAEAVGLDLDDIALMASELATNAVRHTRSGLPGGQFAVRVDRGRARVRVEVIDHGAHNLAPLQADDEHGRGLLIVDMLSTRWGIDGDQNQHTVWFEITTALPRRP